MKVGTWKQFKKVNRRLNEVEMGIRNIDAKLDQIIVGLDDEAAAKALADTVRANTAELKKAIPNTSA